MIAIKYRRRFPKENYMVDKLQTIYEAYITNRESRILSRLFQEKKKLQCKEKVSLAKTSANLFVNLLFHSKIQLLDIIKV